MSMVFGSSAQHLRTYLPACPPAHPLLESFYFYSLQDLASQEGDCGIRPLVFLIFKTGYVVDYMGTKSSMAFRESPIYRFVPPASSFSSRVSVSIKFYLYLVLCAYARVFFFFTVFFSLENVRTLPTFEVLSASSSSSSSSY